MSTTPASDHSVRQEPNPIVGSGEHIYEVIHDWGELPSHIRYGNVHGVVEDANVLIHVHHTVHQTSESSDATVVFDADRQFVRSWGSDFKGGAHGLHINREGGEEFLYMCDIERNIVVKMTLEGEEVLRIGTPGNHPDTSPARTAKNRSTGPRTWLFPPTATSTLETATARAT